MFFLITTCLISCKQKEVQGIVIREDLYSALNYSQNKKLAILIKKTLNNDKDALANLNNFNCGGGAGCYDLGYVLTQIIYKLGETEFVQLVNRLNPNEVRTMLSLIGAGLEYGDDTPLSKENSDKIQVEFPELFLVLEYRKLL